MGYDITWEEVLAKLTNERAINYAKIYTPEKPELLPEMVDSLLHAPDEEQFKNFTMLYILDMKYPRADIALATGIVSREKGWPLT
jgi:hypothetical protein